MVYIHEIDVHHSCNEAESESDSVCRTRVCGPSRAFFRHFCTDAAKYESNGCAFRLV